jgi:hypothetical protein
LYGSRVSCSFISTVLEVRAVIPGGTTANAVDKGDEDEDATIEYGKTPPFLPYVGQHSSLA